MEFTKKGYQYGRSSVSSEDDAHDQATYGSLSTHDYAAADEHALYRSVAVDHPNTFMRHDPVQNGKGFSFSFADKALHTKDSKSGKQNWKKQSDVSNNSFPFQNKNEKETVKHKCPPCRLGIATISLCHVYVMLSIQRLCDLLNGVFEDDSIDYSFDSTKCVWSLTLYSSGFDRTNIAVYVYSLPNKENTILVEFVKESGCAFELNTLFQKVHSVLNTSGVVCNADGEPITTVKQETNFPSMNMGLPLMNNHGEVGLSLSREGSSPFNSENTCMSQTSLFPDDVAGDDVHDLCINMASSDMLDIKLDGFKLIASELDKGGKQAAKNFVKCIVPGKSSFVSFLVSSAESKICCVSRCAVSSLAFISEFPEFRCLLKDADAIRTLIQLAWRESTPLETIHQVLNVLYNFCEGGLTDRVQYVLSQGGKRLFYSCKNSPVSSKKIKEVASKGLDYMSSFDNVILLEAEGTPIKSLSENLKKSLRLNVSHVQHSSDMKLKDRLSAIVMFLPYADMKDTKDYMKSLEKVNSLKKMIGQSTFLTSVVLVITARKDKDSDVFSVTRTLKFAKKLEKDASVHFADCFVFNDEEADSSNLVSDSHRSTNLNTFQLATDENNLLELVKQSLCGIEGFEIESDETTSKLEHELTEAQENRLTRCQLWLEDLRRELSTYSHNKDRTVNTVRRIFDRLKWIRSTLEASSRVKLDLD